LTRFTLFPPACNWRICKGRTRRREFNSRVAKRLLAKGGVVSRRFVILLLIGIVALVVASTPMVAQVSGPARRDLGESRDSLDVNADEIATWEENGQRIVSLSGKVIISQGANLIQSNRAFLWMPINESDRNGPTHGELFAEGNLRMSLNGKAEKLPSVVVQFSTARELRFQGSSRIEKKSLAGTTAYQQALQARLPRPEPLKLPAELRAPPGGNPNIQLVQNVAPPLDPLPGSKGGPPTLEQPIFETPNIPLPNVSTRKLKVSNRSSNPTSAKFMNLPNGEQIAIVTGGIKLLAMFEGQGGLILDMEADQLVVWQKGGKPQDLVDAMRDNDGVTQGNEKETEVYLSGNVVIRYGAKKELKRTAANQLGIPDEDKVLRAERVYYDVTHNRAVAINADLEMIKPGLPMPAHFRSEEIQQLSLQEWMAIRSIGSASRLPSDPGLDIRMQRIKITEEKEQVRRTIFGTAFIDRETGDELVGSERRFKARNSYVELAGVPIMWYPYLAGDVNDPTGPLKNLVYRQDQIFGSQILTTWDVMELIGVKKLRGERWDLMADYLSDRGPAFGTVYDVAGEKLFGIEAPFATHFQAYGINDKGFDQLGGTRNLAYTPTEYRGRVNWRHVQEYDNFTFQGQVAYLSDRNFLEQYYKYEFDSGPNLETFGYLKYQDGIGAVSILAQPNLDRPWVTETQWLPKAEAYWLGQSLFDVFTYNTWLSAGYANLQTFSLPVNELPTTINPATVPTETPIQTGRFDWMQQLSLPFSAGAFRVVPYVNGDVTYYTQDYSDESRARLYGGGGTRVNLPLSRLYESVDSELLNLHGLFHKMTFSGNYYTAYSDTPNNLLPQLDRLNDDATQQAVRDITPWQQTFVPGIDGNALYTSPLYNPRLYAIRRLVDTRVDTLDTMQVVQADVRQRFQTKRGYPGQEHTVDVFSFDLSASFFPAANRDNFGHPVSFIEYQSQWAVGDRNGFIADGWVDPFAFGTRYWSLGTYYNRPDGTNFSLSYKQFEPVNSRLVSGSVSYIFSPKYAVSFFTAYDFGLQANLSSGMTFTRTGTDLTWSAGFTYNAIINNFGFSFMVVPNLLAMKGGAGSNPFNSGGSNMGRR